MFVIKLEHNEKTNQIVVKLQSTTKKLTKYHNRKTQSPRQRMILNGHIWQGHCKYYYKDCFSLFQESSTSFKLPLQKNRNELQHSFIRI